MFIAVIALIGGTIALVPIVIIPLLVLVNFLVQMPLNDLVQKSHASTTERNAVLIESLSGSETIKCMRAEGLMQKRWETVIRSLAKIGVKMRSLAVLKYEIRKPIFLRFTF